jgi:hypothetical protein
MRKYRKRILFAAVAVVFFPALLFLLLWWDSRPKDPGKVFIGYMKTVAQGGSNAVIFVVTNQSDFPVGYAVFFQTSNNSRSDDWTPVIPNQPPSTWQFGSNSPMSTSLVSVGAFSTNRWRIQILGSDIGPTVIGQTRDWLAWHLYDLDYDWARWLQGKVTKVRANVDVIGPEMLGDAPAQSTE